MYNLSKTNINLTLLTNPKTNFKNETIILFIIDPGSYWSNLTK